VAQPLEHVAAASPAEYPDVAPGRARLALDRPALGTVADKVQNRKDFLLHHHGRHPRSDALDRYFRLWLERLDVPEARFAALFDDLQVTAAPTPLASLRPGACSP
jgi:hypothetical protein